MALLVTFLLLASCGLGQRILVLIHLIICLPDSLVAHLLVVAWLLVGWDWRFWHLLTYGQYLESFSCHLCTCLFCITIMLRFYLGTFCLGLTLVYFMDIFFVFLGASGSGAGQGQAWQKSMSKCLWWTSFDASRDSSSCSTRSWHHRGVLFWCLFLRGGWGFWSM